MAAWYRSLAENPDALLDCLEADYAVLAEILATFSGRVLDIGGGLGIPRQFLPRQTEYIALEPCGWWQELVRAPVVAKYPILAVPALTVHAVGEFIPFPNEHFDGILILWTLNHVSQPRRVLAEALRVLKPGGQLLIALEDPGAGPSELAPDHICVDDEALSALSPMVTRDLALDPRYRIVHATWPDAQPGPVDFGDFRQVTPVARQFGYSRGTPIDRVYIERFVHAHAQFIAGRVLEVGDATYTRRFGGSRVSHSDVWHVQPGVADVTIVGDLTDAPEVQSDTFDCIICTQTLQLIYDLRAAVSTLHRILKPGGSVLCTLPGITATDDEWKASWYWSVTPQAAQRLFADVFGAGRTHVVAHGNSLVATAFLQGLAAEELRDEELASHDTAFPLVVTVLATKGENEPTRRLVSVETLPLPIGGVHLDTPVHAGWYDASAIPVSGWRVEPTDSGPQITRWGPAPDVELRSGMSRPDVGRHFPLVPLRCGFEDTVDGRELGDEIYLRSGRCDGTSRLVAAIHLSIWHHTRERRPLTSIVIPCFNHAAYLREAIESALVQAGSAIEVIVVDDGSTDETARVAAEFTAVRYHYQLNGGLPSARNAGLRLSAGDFVVFLDADDRLLPGAVARGLESLRAHPDAVLTSGEHRYIDLHGTVLKDWVRDLPSGDNYCALLRGNYIGMVASAMFRREPLAAINGFDETLRACEDYDVYLRLASKQPVATHSNVVAEYRRLPDGISADPTLMLECALRVLAAAKTEGLAERKAAAEGRRYWRRLYGALAASRACDLLSTPGRRLRGAHALLGAGRRAPSETFGTVWTRWR